MDEQVVVVKMAEMQVMKAGNGTRTRLKATLGSCVGVVLSDTRSSIHGMAHILLPTRQQERDAEGKYADTAIPCLLKKMELMGSRRRDIRAYLVGGACLFQFLENLEFTRIGEKNIEASLAALRRLDIPLVFQDTGGHCGRTVIFDSDARAPLIRMLDRVGPQ